jgi:hypothetical protein
MALPNGYNTVPHSRYLEAIAGAVGSAGTTYYVEGNAGDDTNDGLSWETAFKTFAVAVTASNADIASGSTGWASRNTILIKSDNKEASKETIITLPNKCDVIGVGSYDHRQYPVFIGNHVIGAGAYMGTRFFNVGFWSLAAGGAIFTVPTTTSGLQFIGCYFDGSTATAGTIGVSLTACENSGIEDCEFIGAFSTAAINIGAGASNGLIIRNNKIMGAVNGIVVNSSATCASRMGVIEGNYIDVTTLAIDENSDKFGIVNNTMISAGGNGYAACVDVSITRCSGNVLTTANGTCYDLPPKAGALA